MTSLETFLKPAMYLKTSALYLVLSLLLKQVWLEFTAFVKGDAEGCFCGFYSLFLPSSSEPSRDIYLLCLILRTLFLLCLAESTCRVPIFVLPFFHEIAFLAQLQRKIKTILSLHCNYGQKTEFWPTGCKQKDNVMASRILKDGKTFFLHFVISNMDVAIFDSRMRP